MNKILPIFLALTSALAAYTDEEIVATTLILEAGGEYVHGSMEAVNEVIQNRAKKRNMSEAKVCLQRFQFSCWNYKSVSENIQKAKRHTRWGEAMRIVKSSVKTNFAKGADHYHSIHVDPYWNEYLTPTARIGNHIFYK